MNIKNVKRVFGLFMMFVLLVNMIPALGDVHAVEPKTIPNGVYVLETALKEGKNVDVDGSRKDKDAKIHIWDQNHELNQSFYFIYDPLDGYYTTIALHSQKCLGVQNISDGQGAQIQQYSVNLRDNFKWKISPLGNGYYDLELKSNGLKLDVSGGNSANGTPLHLWPSNSTNAQKFRFFFSSLSTPRINQLFSEVIRKTREDASCEAIRFDSNIEKISKEMVYIYENLERVEICLTIRDVEANAFLNHTKIHRVSAAPEWLSRFNRANLKKVIIPYGVKRISKDDLKGCTRLEYLSIPPSVTDIEDGAFSDLDPTVTFECDEKLLRKFQIGKYKIPDGVKILKKDCDGSPTEVECMPELLRKLNKTDIRRVVIPNGVKKISRSDFSGFYELDLLELPESIEEIEEDAFEDCRYINMGEIKCDFKWFRFIKPKICIIPGNITRLNIPMFQNWKQLETLFLDENISDIDPGTFDFCENLTYLRSDPKWIKFFKHKDKLEIIVIPEGVKKLFKTDFEDCSGLKHLKLPSTIEEIEEGTLDDCKGPLNTICSNLVSMKFFKYASVKIPENVASLTREMFKGFTSIKELEIPYSVKSIEDGTFDDCANLTSIKCDPKWYYLFSKSLITKAAVVDGVERVDHAAFEEFKELERIEVPEKTQMTRTSEEILRETTVQDLLKADPANAKYIPYVTQILDDLKAGTASSKGDEKSLDEISGKVTSICQKIRDNFGKTIRPVQCLAVLRLCDEILNGPGKGAIGEVKTGEGKSLIISVTAIVMTQYGRKTDIVTSTLYLAKRDQEEQKSYYDMFGIRSGVLYNLKSDEEYFAKDKTANMEDFNFNQEVFEGPIVYSTNFNFQFAHLEDMFGTKNVRGGRPFDVVIVDEIDNMLIDQAMSPAVLSVPIPIKNYGNVLSIVYAMRYMNIAEIQEMLKSRLQETVDEKVLVELKESALTASKLSRDVNYYLAGGSAAVIIDSTTGSAKLGCKWSKYVHSMIEVKEGIRLSESSVSYCGMTQRAYFNMYGKIAGVTGTVGPEFDQDILIKSYGVNIFKVPRHIEREKIIRTAQKPNIVPLLHEKILENISFEQKSGRPVLIIFATKKQAEDFLSKYPQFTNKILGIDPANDKAAVERAGISGVITIATNAAGRGIDIKLDGTALKSGGLHVIIPEIPRNERTFEQAIGRSGRQGQPGLVTVYLGGNEQYERTPDFDERYETLLDITKRFSRYTKETWPWIYEGDGKILLTMVMKYPIGMTPKESLSITAKNMLEVIGFEPVCARAESIRAFDDFVLQMVLSSWGTFFTDMQKVANKTRDREVCEAEYAKFLENLNEWLPETCKTQEQLVSHLRAKFASDILKDIDWSRVVITVTISATGVVATIACPGAAPIIATLTGAALEGSLSIYDQMQGGGEVDWARVGVNTVSGGAKGFAITSPLGALATGAIVGGIGAAQSFTDSAIAGDSSLESLKRSLVTGTVEGATAGGLKWVGNKFTQSKKVGDKLKTDKPGAQSLNRTNTVAEVTASAEKSSMTRVGRWMSRAEYDKMVETGRVQISGDNKTHVANPANLDSFRIQAPKGSVYVEFDVPSNTVFPGGRDDWGIIAGPGSLNDRFNQSKGLPPIVEMPRATNIITISVKG